MNFYKYTRFDIKNKMNPVPSCSKDKIYENNNDFYLSEIKEYEGLGVKRSRISYTFNNFSKEDLYKLHKNSNFYQSELLIVKPPPTIVSRNKHLGQYPYNSFMGTADMLQILEKEIHYHGRNCTGSLNYESKSYISKRGLCIMTKLMCELREDCKCWDRGVKKWASAATLEIDGKLQYSFNVKFVIAQAMNPISKSALEDSMRTMCLSPPSRKYSDKIFRSYVWPSKIREMKESMEREQIEKLRNLNRPLSISFDAGHNHSRGSQGATACVASDGEIILIKTDVTSAPVCGEVMSYCDISEPVRTRTCYFGNNLRMGHVIMSDRHLAINRLLQEVATQDIPSPYINIYCVW